MRNRNTLSEYRTMANNLHHRWQFTQSRIACLVIASLALGQNNISIAQEHTQAIETITVTATRTAQSVTEIAGTVSVIGSDQIQQEIANGIDDLIRYEPGVSVSGGGRFGLNSFSIRGVGGDRVLTLVDSTPTADEFSFGPFLSSRRDFVDLDALKSVEIVRGPGSSVYGSNAIGGVVNFITKAPVDYLDGKAVNGSIKLGTSSADSSSNATILSAFGNETLSGMIVGTLRSGSETESYFDDNSSGPERRSENPQENENRNIYAKFVYAPSENQNISFVAERFSADSETNVLSSAGTFTRGVLTNSQQGIDERNRERFSINYDLSLPSLLTDSINLLVYSQSSEASQDTLTERVSLGALQDRIRTSAFTQDNTGFRAQFGKTVESESFTHALTYGVDYDQSESSTLRTGQTVNRADGSLAIEFSNFPTRDFPNSEYTSLGIFIQNEVEILQRRLRVIPSLRYDSFELEPSADAIYLAGNTGSPTPEGYDESELSAKLGAIYKLSDTWSIYAQYAEGFRAPPLDAVNTGFTNFAGGYTTLPNPDLRPERGTSTEVGVRRISDYGSIEVTAYENRYNDFIESLAVRGFNPLTGLLEFQARNLDQARIKGAEFKARYRLAALSESLEGLQIRASYAYADGENEESNQPLNSIDPQQLVLGLGYAPSSDKWSVEAVLTGTDRKDVVDIDASSLQGDEFAITPFTTPSYANLDLIGHYNLSKRARINWGIFNVTDKQYYRWSEEFVQNPLTTNFDRLTEPGRNYSVTIKYFF